MSVGRNDPCPCGSGRKYKKCHLAEDAAKSPARAPDTTPSPVHHLDARVLEDVMAFLKPRFAPEMVEELAFLEADPHLDVRFVVPWLGYTALYDGRTGVDWYLDDRGWTVSAKARAWLDAVRASWLSIWDVESVEPGRIVLFDVLTETEKTVYEISAARMMTPGHVVLTRVVDFEGQSFLTSMHPVPLRPMYAMDIAETIRRVVRRKNVVPPERLRNPKIASRMLDEWGRTVAAVGRPPRLSNTDGDPILFTQDRWRIAEGAKDAIAARLQAMDDVEETDDGFVFLTPPSPDREDGSTVLGGVTIDDRTMRLETNSLARADALVTRIEDACGDLAGARVRSHTDPLSMLDAARSSDSPLADEPEHTAETSALLRAYKERHYATWPDEPVPALQGRTPREAVQTSEGRRRVDAMLRDFELAEAKVAEAERFDVEILRRELGVD